MRCIVPNSHIQPNATKLTGRGLTVQMDVDLKHTVKATQDLFEGEEVEYSSTAKSVS